MGNCVSLWCGSMLLVSEFLGLDGWWWVLVCWIFGVLFSSSTIG